GIIKNAPDHRRPSAGTQKTQPIFPQHLSCSKAQIPSAETFHENPSFIAYSAYFLFLRAAPNNQFHQLQI
ncbi:hypothetical protein, partial [Ralstonia solanacearum]|uniref:hypothetical protein n=1 Tax=Ralstonia solanacearum TaxID=305 RepID=UPI001E2A45BD